MVHHKVVLIWKCVCFVVFEKSMSICFCTEMSFNDETDTAEIIDQMFEEVLEYAGRLEEDNKDCNEDYDGGIGASSVDGGRMDTESEKEKHEQECQKAKKSEDTEDELLTFPPSGILSPLSKSVEAVVTALVRPLNLTFGEIIVKALRAGLYSSPGYMWPSGLRLPTSALKPTSLIKCLSIGCFVFKL